MPLDYEALEQAIARGFARAMRERDEALARSGELTESESMVAAIVEFIPYWVREASTVARAKDSAQATMLRLCKAYLYARKQEGDDDGHA